METTGRHRRLRSLLGDSGRTVILPVDQPVSVGPLDGIKDLDRMLPVLLSNPPDALLCHRGVVRRVPAELGHRTRLILHLSAGTSLSGQGHVKALTGTVVEAVKLGVDAVSVQVTLGTPEEQAMLADLGRVSKECAEWGMPLLTMVYVHGMEPAAVPAAVAHGARVAAELGSDIVKVPWTGSSESFASVVDSCFTPVVVAGGERTADWRAVVDAVKGALAAGAAGCCVGRNVFQHEDPRWAAAELREIVHGTGGPTPASGAP